MDEHTVIGLDIAKRSFRHIPSMRTRADRANKAAQEAGARVSLRAVPAVPSRWKPAVARTGGRDSC